MTVPDRGVVIVGAGHAGGTAAALLRQYGYEKPIVLIGEEPLNPYQRPPLSKAWLKGEADGDSLALRPLEFYAEHGIDLRLGVEATRIDPTHQSVSLSDGSTVSYDHLILATGARARLLDVPGADLVGVHVLRTAADAEAIKAQLGEGRTLAVVGGGYVGLEVAASARALGAEVVVLERSIPRMRELDDLYQGRILTRYSTLAAVEDEILKADVIIGAVLTAGAAAPKLVKREHLKQMKPGSVLVDVSIDQGGCFETSHPTTHAEPTYTVDGVVHYCVANMPGAAPRTSSEALGNATLPFGLALADHGLDALKTNIHLAKGLNVLAGELTHPAVAEALGKTSVDPHGAWN